MIPISKIDHNFSIYQKHTVVLWGVGAGTAQLIALLEGFHLPFLGPYEEDPQVWGTEVEGYTVLSPEDLKKEVEDCGIKGKHPILVQYASTDLSKTVTPSVISAQEEILWEEAMAVLTYHHKKDRYLEEAMSFAKNYVTAHTVTPLTFTVKEDGTLPVLLCLPPKTGDMTLGYTFKDNQIPYYQLWHKPEHLDLAYLNSLSAPVKIITAVRDPLSACLSGFYENLGSMRRTMFFPGLMQRVNPSDTPIFKEGGDAQILFDLYLRQGDYYEPLDLRRGTYSQTTHIQKFFQRFDENLFNLLDYPFDTEAGYTIITEGNIQIFIYQLEQLNQLIPEISAFVGKPFQSFSNANVAAEKWVANSYVQAKKEIKIAPEVCEAYYSEDYVTHFYNESQIQAFKEKWANNISEEKSTSCYKAVDTLPEEFLNKRIILWDMWGWAYWLVELFRSYGVEVAGICDNNPKKWGETIHGVTILSPTQVASETEGDPLLVISTCPGSVGAHVFVQLEEMGLTSYLSVEDTLKKFKVLG